MPVAPADQVRVSPATKLPITMRAEDMLALSVSVTDVLAVAAIRTPVASPSV